jgi:hypothetical protein
MWSGHGWLQAIYLHGVLVVVLCSRGEPLEWIADPMTLTFHNLLEKLNIPIT